MGDKKKEKYAKSDIYEKRLCLGNRAVSFYPALCRFGIYQPKSFFHQAFFSGFGVSAGVSCCWATAAGSPAVPA